MPENINSNNNRWPRTFPIDGQDGSDTLWLRLIVWKINSQNLDARTGGGVVSSRVGELYFLPTGTIAENIAHEWDEYEGFGTRLQQKASDISHLIHETQNAWEGVKAGVQGIAAGQKATTTTQTSLQKQTVEKFKVDAPLVYKNTQRREYQFTFILADQGDLQKDILEPLDYLRRFSCAEKKGIIQLDFPYIFSLDTIDGWGYTVPIVNIPRAALRGLQPTYEGPYRRGIPSKAEIQCTFVDMEPLYRSTWDYGTTKVTATERGQETKITPEQTTEWLDGGKYGG